jgi:radical SAM superfamily enzyme YgiQ (UPF0313 family)
VTWNRGRDARHHLAGEQGTLIKDWGGQFPVALVYPNSYYLGMSNLGVHTIYSQLNGSPGVVCERVFWEQPDDGPPQPPVSIESRRQLSEFAMLAFSVTYELDYVNIPRILRAAGIPLQATDRDATHPLIIAGGACLTANPMPVAPFFDALCIGEAEAILPQLLSALSHAPEGGRTGQLAALSHVPGIYLPHATGAPVFRQWAKNLDDVPVHSAIVTDDTELGDLYLIEVERGCRWACRFCLVCGVFRPMRLHSVESIVAQAKVGLRYRKRLGLVGPDVPDHPGFEDLLNRLKALGADISVSSLRIKPLFDLALSELARGGAGTVSFAPEAGSERLRGVIRKGITEDDILRAVEFTSRHKLRQLRMYFMVGLPTETDDDVEAIASLTLRCKSILEKRTSTTRITLSVAPFVPKAGTAFERLPMERLPVLDRRLSLLRKRLRVNGIKVTGDSPAWSEVQTILARGDASLASVLANTRETTLAAWNEAVRTAGIDVDALAHQRWTADYTLPWHNIDSGFSRDHLRSEMEAALSDENGPDDAAAVE